MKKTWLFFILLTIPLLKLPAREFVPSQADKAGCNYRYVQVIDQRKNKYNIGQQPLDKMLEDQAASQFRNVEKSVDTLLLVVYDFIIEKQPIEEQFFGTFYFRAQFFLGGNDQYKLIKDVDNLHEIATPKNSAGAVLESSLKILDNLFRYAAKENFEGMVANVFPLEEATELIVLQKKQYPIYQAGSFKEGIYFTLEDFLNHNAANIPYLKKDQFLYEENRPFFFYKNEKNKKGEAITDVFAIYTGKAWYQPHKNGWTKLSFREGDFYAKKHFEGGTVDLSPEMNAGTVFGIVGALAVHVLTPPGKRACLYDARLDPVKQEFCPVRRLR